MSETITPEQQLRNVAEIVLRYTEVTRAQNGRGRRPTYAADAGAIRDAGRQLAEMVLAQLDGDLSHVEADEAAPF